MGPLLGFWTYMAFKVPMPLGVVMVAQVPAGTNFQALAW